MRLSSQNNMFIFNFPIDFIEDYLYEEFQKMMDKNFIPYDSAIDYINSTIKEINLSGMKIDTVEQTIKRGKIIRWKDAKNVTDKFNRDVEITFRSVDSWLNYFMLMQLMSEFYLNVSKHSINAFSLEILDIDGSVLYTLLFKDLILKNLSDIRLGYQQYNIDEETFTLGFDFNWIDILWQLDDNNLRSGVSIFDIPIDFKPGKLDKKFGNEPYSDFERKSRIKF